MCGIGLVVSGIEVVGPRGEEAGQSGDDSQENIGHTAKHSSASHYDFSLVQAIQNSVETAELHPSLLARGPDSIGSLKRSPADGVEFEIVGSLLQLRGSYVSHAPLEDSEGNILAFNGEIFGGLNMENDENDGHALLNALASDIDGVVEKLSKLRGPWALFYWQEKRKRLWIGRDGIGRRSLLLHLPNETDNRFILSSTTPLPQSNHSENSVKPSERTDPHWKEPYGWTEVPPGIYSLSFNDINEINGINGINGENGINGINEINGINGENGVLVARWERHIMTDGIWNEILRKESGMAGTSGQSENEQENEELAVSEEFPCYTGGPNFFKEAPGNLQEAAEKLLMKLKESVRVRCGNIDWWMHSFEQAACSTSLLRPSPVLVMFSGGVDSTLIAALTHYFLPKNMPIDLANVSFAGGTAPDRKSGISALIELRKWAPDRLWRFIEVDATLDDVDEIRSRLLSLLHPCSSIMDLNIGAPLWLAARGKGRLNMALDEIDQLDNGHASVNENLSTIDGCEFVSEARVVLMGHGADEQCAGYARHVTKFRDGGWAALRSELNLEVQRLWLRNLGRDDRLASDHGREARFPFLDENVAQFLAHLPMKFLFNPNLPRGEGDKMVLRECLRILGLSEVSQRVKRAIQFGTRISKQANCREFGSNRAANKLSAGYIKLSDVPNAKK